MSNFLLSTLAVLTIAVIYVQCYSEQSTEVFVAQYCNDHVHRAFIVMHCVSVSKGEFCQTGWIRNWIQFTTVKLHCSLCTLRWSNSE